ncbi:MAG TPA: ATP-binding protein [Gemmatimonadales bacterium]|nr:ATP-binding protein [Gemmatimonadales bacterium]
MAGPTLQSPPAGLRVLADVIDILAAGFVTEDALARVTVVLRRGLDLADARLWLRAATGAGYRLLAGSPPAASEPLFAPTEAWFRQDLERERIAGGGMRLRFPLVFEEQGLGALELRIAGARSDGLASDVGRVVARLLAAVVAATELSQDLASEVALAAREADSQRNFVARIIDSLPTGLYVIDRDYIIRAWNRQRESGTQGVARDDAVGREIFGVLDRQPRDVLRREFDRVFETGEIQQMEMESTASGESRYYRVSKIPMRLDDVHITHVITIAEEVTEWRRAQQRLAQTEKLAAVGQLAAGVMHEINNPLATILACAEALSARAEELTGPARAGFEEYLKIIDAEVQRCRRIVDGLLDLSRPKTGEKQRVDVNHLVEQTLFLLKHHERFKRISVRRQFSLGLPPVLVDPERLIQGFMSLMLNAMDAMNTRGVLTVRSSRSHSRGAGGEEVLVEFIDTGTGIRPEELSKIFEPFYTTKPQGRGTGLGLSICYGIVADHQGRIEVESQVGVGSNFKVYLPAVQ